MPLNRPVTQDALLQAICEVARLQPDEVVPSARLVDDLGLDSIDQIEIAMWLEQTFGATVCDADKGVYWETVQDILDTCLQRDGALVPAV